MTTATETPLDLWFIIKDPRDLTVSERRSVGLVAWLIAAVCLLVSAFLTPIMFVVVPIAQMVLIGVAMATGWYGWNVTHENDWPEMPLRQIKEPQTV